MNFRGQYRKGRSINLGGKNSTVASRDSILKKAQLDRERREQARSEEKAAIRIQHYYRSKQRIAHLRLTCRQQWIDRYLLRNGLTDSRDVIACILLFMLSSKALFVSSHDETDLQILSHLDYLLVKHNSYQQVDTSYVNSLFDCFSYVLGSLSSQNNQAGISCILDIINHLSFPMPRNLFQVLGRISFEEFTNSSSSLIIEKLAEKLAIAAASYSDLYYQYFLSMPRITDKYPQFLQDSINQLVSKPIETSIDIAGKPQDRLWVLTNLVSTLSKTTLTYQHISLLSYILTSLKLTIVDNNSFSMSDSDSESDSQDQAVADTTHSRVTVQNSTQQWAVNGLYSGSFTSSVFSLAENSDDISAIGSLFVSLIALVPSRHKDILLYLSVVSGPTSAVQVFWKSFKDTGIFDLFLSKCLNTVDILSLSLHDQAWSKLLLSLELYSYWLIVADDNEFLTNSTQGLPIEEVRILAKLLKNICFSLVWNWAQLKESADPMVSLLLSKIKNAALLLIRQLYIRDSRRPFLEKNFWLMTDSFNMDVFIPMVVEEHERQREVDSDSEDESAAHAENSRSQFGLNQYQHLAPRLELLRQVPFFMPFDVRVHIFKAFIELDKSRMALTNLGTSWRSPGALFGGIQDMARVKVDIHRETLLPDAFDAFSNIPSQDFKLPIAVTFHNEYGPEAGIDGGGLTKEFLTSVSQEGFIKGGGDLELFVGTQSHLLYPNPIYGVSPSLSALSRDEVETALGYYTFLGKVIGKCLYEEILVDTEFAPFFLQKWAAFGSRSNRSSFDDLYTLDPQIYDSLVKLRNYPGDVENDLRLDFTVTQDVGNGRQRDVELRPDGENTPVTKANMLQYIHSIANYKLNTVLGPQTKAFLQGVGSIISLDWLGMFNANELQMLISGGKASIDIADLKANCVYSNGYHIQHPTIVAFWQALDEFSETDRREFIKFVTSVPKAPLLGFSQLNPKLAIHNAGPDLSRLPTASTCVNMLKLPDYRDPKLLKEKLQYSIRAEAGFDLS